MSHIITYNPEWQIFEIKFQGSLTLNELKETYLEAMPMALEHDCFLFLNDLSEATIQLSVFDIVGWANTILELAKNYGQHAWSLRRAIILPANYDESRFAENVAVNRGHAEKLFQNVDDARKWLSEK